jgi:hypothetical protein
MPRLNGFRGVSAPVCAVIFSHNYRSLREMAPVPGHPRHSSSAPSPAHGDAAAPCLHWENAPVFVTARLPREPPREDGLIRLPDEHTTEEDAEW